MPDAFKQAKQGHVSTGALRSSIGMLEDGLVLGAGSILVRMMKGAGGSWRLAIDADRDRLLTMLSAARGSPVAAAEVLPHLEAAALHWERGDKALANLRLVFADLPRLVDQAAVDRLTLAEEVLDGGMSPAELMKACWPAEAADDLGKYNPNQPRVPADNGRRSGEWDFGGGGAAADGHEDRDRKIRVAEEDDPTAQRPMEDELPRGGLIPRDHAHGRVQIFDPLSGLPGGLKANRASDVSAAAKAAVEAVGPGKGPIFGTAVHTEFKRQVQALGLSDLYVEQSYRNGKLAEYGSPGSVRVDAAEGSAERPHAIYDVKTGSARLTDKRIKSLRDHLPDGASVIIREVRP